MTSIILKRKKNTCIFLLFKIYINICTDTLNHFTICPKSRCISKIICTIKIDIWFSCYI